MMTLVLLIAHLFTSIYLRTHQRCCCRISSVRINEKKKCEQAFTIRDGSAFIYILALCLKLKAKMRERKRRREEKPSRQIICMYVIKSTTELI